MSIDAGLTWPRPLTAQQRTHADPIGWLAPDDLQPPSPPGLAIGEPGCGVQKGHS